MYKILIPIKEKSDIHGLWSDNGKTYFDKIKIVNTYAMNKAIKEDLCRKYNQLALFYTDEGIGYCYTLKTNTTDILKNHKIINLPIQLLNKSFIVHLLKLYGGITIYKTALHYKIGIYYNEKD